MVINWNELKKKQLGRLALDLFMLLIAILNILLISFDLTYLLFRNFYFHNLPKVVSIYDQVKGIEPHRFTESYLAKANSFFTEFKITENLQEIENEMINLSLQMIDEDPFKISSNGGDLELIKERMKKFTGVKTSSKEAFKYFWKMTPDNYEEREKFFRTKIKPVLETNYWRGINTSGRYTDYFIYLDLIFIIIFLSEFLIMYRIAIKQYGSEQKILYPLYHWYDLVSCIPLQQFRFLRLFRILSVYIRLRKGDIIIVGDGVISGQIRKYRNMIAEELSDQVSYQILENIQKELELGVNRDILKRIITPHRYAIRDVIVKNLKKFEVRALSQKHDEWVNFLSELVDDALKNTDEYRKVVHLPIIGDKVRFFLSREKITEMVDRSVNNFSDTLDQALDSESGMVFINSLVDDLIDEFLLILDDENILNLIAKINIQIVQELKKGLEIKTWKLEQDALKRLSSDFV